MTKFHQLERVLELWIGNVIEISLQGKLKAIVLFKILIWFLANKYTNQASGILQIKKNSHKFTGFSRLNRSCTIPTTFTLLPPIVLCAYEPCITNTMRQNCFLHPLHPCLLGHTVFYTKVFGHLPPQYKILLIIMILGISNTGILDVTISFSINKGKTSITHCFHGLPCCFMAKPQYLVLDYHLIESKGMLFSFRKSIVINL